MNSFILVFGHRLRFNPWLQVYLPVDPYVFPFVLLKLVVESIVESTPK
jgi:hypothetical protein